MCLAGKCLIIMLILHRIHHNTHTHSISSCYPPTIHPALVFVEETSRHRHPTNWLAAWLSDGLPHPGQHRKGNRNRTHKHRFMGSSEVDKA